MTFPLASYVLFIGFMFLYISYYFYKEAQKERELKEEARMAEDFLPLRESEVKSENE